MADDDVVIEDEPAGELTVDERIDKLAEGLAEVSEAVEDVIAGRDEDALERLADALEDAEDASE